NVENRLSRIDGPNDVAYWFFKRRRACAGADEQSESGAICLGQRTVNQREFGVLIDRVKSHPRDNSDNFRNGIAFLVVPDVNHQTLADWIVARKNLLGQGLINNNHARGIRGIARIKCAATQQRHFERWEVVTGNNFKIGARHVARCGSRNSFSIKTGLPSTHEGGVGTNPDIFDAWEGSHFLEERVRKSSYFFSRRINAERKIHFGANQSARLVTEFESLHAGKAFQNKRGCDQQSQRERDLTAHGPVAGG